MPRHVRLPPVPFRRGDQVLFCQSLVALQFFLGVVEMGQILIALSFNFLNPDSIWGFLNGIEQRALCYPLPVGKMYSLDNAIDLWFYIAPLGRFYNPDCLKKQRHVSHLNRSRMYRNRRRLEPLLCGFI